MAEAETPERNLHQQRKETRRELERLIKYNDAETLSTEMIISLGRSVRPKKKKLHVDYEKLQAAHLISREKCSQLNGGWRWRR